MAQKTGSGCIVNQISPDTWLLDFDGVAPGGAGGGSVFVDSGQSLASITIIHKNTLLPPRSTGPLLADCLRLIGLTQPAIIEAYNVREKKTLVALTVVGDGHGTPVGYLLENTSAALGGTSVRMETIRDGIA